MNIIAKRIIIFLVFVIVALSVLLTMVTIRYLNICKIAGMGLSITNHDYEELKRKELAEIDNQKDVNLVSLNVENVTKTSAILVIADGNNPSFNWTENYIIKKKINNEYIELEGKCDFDLTEIILGQNGEYKQVIDWNDTYGELEKGYYVIEKMVITANSTISFMTEEFEIK